MKVYNTLTKKKEDFEPIEEGKVIMYVCGLTPYDHAHLGHARTYVAFDVIKRYFLFKGYDVIHIQNITDVDDKILRRSKESGENPVKLAERFHREALELFDKLNILRADYYPKVSEHISDIVEMIQKIMENGYAYETPTGVYFDVEKFKDYGKLSGQRIEEIKEKHRIEPDPTKKSPIDFALWKKTKPGEEPIGWESPFGYGRPGWHIECSAMSLKYAGRTLDVHGGAKDLIFPHHENEIAQSEAATGKKFVKYWLHTGFLTVNGVKMSKSLGNFITLKEALDKHDPMHVRLLFIMTKYSSPIDYSEKALEQMKEVYESIVNSYRSIEEALASEKENDGDRGFREEIKEEYKNFIAAMEDDFDTARGMAAFFNMMRKINKHLQKERIDKSALKIAKFYFDNILFILGIKLPSLGGEEEKILKGILKMREEFRKKKMYEVSDKIREMLREEGYEIHDTPEGPKVRKV